MIKLVCNPSHALELKKRLQEFEVLDLTLIEKGQDCDEVGIQFQIDDLEVLLQFLRHHFLAENKKTISGLIQERRVVILLKDVFYIEGLQRETYAYTVNQCILLDHRLYQLEEMLYPEQFIRIGKSYLVNLLKINQIEPSFHGRLTLIMENGLQLEVSRNYAPHFKKAIGMEKKR